MDKTEADETVEGRAIEFINYWANNQDPKFSQLREIALTVAISLPTSSLSESLFSLANNQVHYREFGFSVLRELFFSYKNNAPTLVFINLQ